MNYCLRVPSSTSASDKGELSWTLPTAAILAIAIGIYLVIIVTVLLIRKCLISQGVCGESCSKSFSFDCCSCFRNLAQLCNCQLPTVDNCLDAVCPAKQRLNCVECLICDWASWCQEGGTYTCGSGDCSCTCEAPNCDSINCLCCEISFTNVTVS